MCLEATCRLLEDREKEMAVALCRHDNTTTAKVSSVLAHKSVQLSKKEGGPQNKKSPVLTSVTPILLTFSDCIGGGALTKKINLSDLASVYYNPD